MYTEFNIRPTPNFILSCTHDLILKRNKNTQFHMDFLDTGIDLFLKRKEVCVPRQKI